MIVVHITRTASSLSATASFNDGAVVTVTIPVSEATLSTETELRDYNDDFSNDFNI